VDQGSAEDLTLETLGCGYELGKINVVFTRAVPSYEYNPTCELRANIRNYSKHHLNQLTFEVGTWRFEVGDMVANSYEDDVVMSRINLGKTTCQSQARYLVDNLKDAAALGCSIPNLAEGDCQALITFDTTLNVEALAQIGAEEIALADKHRRAEEEARAAEKAKEAQKQAEQARQQKEISDRMKAAAADRQARCPLEKTGPTYVYCTNTCRDYKGWGGFDGCNERNANKRG
jgi:hypothetical protein